MAGLIDKPVEVAAPDRRGAPPTARRTAATLTLEDGTVYRGESFGAERSVAGEVVFSTGMMGYPETLTDPSFAGQLIVSTYPMVGNYGVPAESLKDGVSQVFESHKIHAEALIVADYSEKYSHWNAARSLSEWLIEQGIPGLTGIDTRSLTQRLREHGTMLGKLEFQGSPIHGFRDPNVEDLGAAVSITTPQLYGTGTKKVVLVDTGCKLNILRSLLERGCQVLRVPHDYDFTKESYDGLLLSNGPGDPTMYKPAIANIRTALAQNTPIFGVCLGNQLLSLAIGARTFKLKYGHRGQNQPVIECGTNRCFVTSQNHGFAVDTASLPADWRPWFDNLNDGTNEGIRHAWAPFRSVQFHPEACPGPVDTAFLFDEFVRMLNR